MSAAATRACTAVLLWLAASCAKPDAVRVVRSPRPGLSFSIETFYGRGAVAPDLTQLYAGYDRGGRRARQLVVDGSYLEIKDLRWADPDQLTICLTGGYTGSFHNEVTLPLDGGDVHIHSRLEDACDVGTSAPTSAGATSSTRAGALAAAPR